MAKTKTPELPGAWEPLAEFIEAGETTRETQMRFNERCDALRREHGTTREQFRRALFKMLGSHTGLSRTEVARKYGFSEDDIPIDIVDEAPDIAREMADANREMSAAVSKIEAARRRQEEADARLARIDELRASVPHLKAALEFVEGLQAQFQAVIDESEEAIRKGVYSLPKYSMVGNPVAFILRQQADIKAARDALEGHSERIKVARQALADVKVEIARLKKGEQKSK